MKPVAARCRCQATMTTRELDEEALVIAMTIAPSAYSRNRMFELFSQAGAKRARTRAAELRGIVRQLARAEDVSIEPRGSKLHLSYTLPRLHFQRKVILSLVEAVAIHHLAERLSIACPEIPGGDPKMLSAILSRLTGGLRLLET